MLERVSNAELVTSREKKVRIIKQHNFQGWEVLLNNLIRKSENISNNKITIILEKI